MRQQGMGRGGCGGAGGGRENFARAARSAFLGGLSEKLKGKLSDKLHLPSFAGVLEVLHSLPGRLRMKIPSLRHNPQAGASFAEKLSALQGIKKVTVNPLIGTVLVQYDPAQLTQILVISAATHCFDFTQMLQGQQSVLWQRVKIIRFALDQTLLRHTRGVLDLRATMTLLLAGSLVFGIARRRGTATFAPLNIIWWLFQSVDR